VAQIGPHGCTRWLHTLAAHAGCIRWLYRGIESLAGGSFNKAHVFQRAATEQGGVQVVYSASQRAVGTAVGRSHSHQCEYRHVGFVDSENRLSRPTKNEKAVGFVSQLRRNRTRLILHEFV
jgi:hypothetical protein